MEQSNATDHSGPLSSSLPFISASSHSISAFVPLSLIQTAVTGPTSQAQQPANVEPNLQNHSKSSTIASNTSQLSQPILATLARTHPRPQDHNLVPSLRYALPKVLMVTHPLEPSYHAEASKLAEWQFCYGC